MIGHYLLTLTEAQEDRVLTHAMRPGDTHMGGYKMAPCVVMTAGEGSGLLGWPRGRGRSAIPSHFEAGRWWRGNEPALGIGFSYDTLCERFGAPRVNVAIRNRILSNRARRVLQNRPVPLETVTP